MTLRSSDLQSDSDLDSIRNCDVLTGPPDFQYQNEKNGSANEELFYVENFVKN